MEKAEQTISDPKKLVSVNITTYNRAHFLSRCLDAVLRQHYEALEINVVDDCSPDNTAEIMAEYVQQDPRIRYFRHETNKGNANARNTALKNCNGYYVAFLDDDDEWIDPDKLIKQVKIFEEHANENIGIVCSNVKIIDQEGNEELTHIEKPEHLAVHLLKRNGIIHNSTVLTTKAIMLEVGGFDTHMLRGVDFEFFREVVVRYKYEIFLMPDVTTAYHIHGGVQMTTNREVGVRKTLGVSLYVLRKHLSAYLTHPSGALQDICAIPGEGSQAFTGESKAIFNSVK